MSKQKAPTWIHPRTMGWITDYQYMNGDERQIVFQAYKINQHKNLYELIKPELLNDSLIEKLRRMD